MNEDVRDINWEGVPPHLRTAMAECMCDVVEWALEHELGESLAGLAEDSSDRGYWPTIDVEFAVPLVENSDLVTVRIRVLDPKAPAYGIGEMQEALDALAYCVEYLKANTEHDEGPEWTPVQDRIDRAEAVIAKVAAA